MPLINKLILGTVQMGIPYGVNNKAGQIPESESLNILRLARESGIDTLDSAEAYGSAHQIIGGYNRENQKKPFNVITKISGGINNHTVEEKLQTFLRELHLEKLDGLMFHSFGAYQEHLHLMDRLSLIKEKGVFRQLGVSVYNNEEIATLIDDDRVDFVQLPFNLLDNISQRGEMIERAKEKRKAIHTRSTFLQGLFFMETTSKHRITEALAPQLLRIRELALEESVSINTLALGYCLAQENIDNVLIGVDSVTQLKKNLEAASFVLSKDTMNSINSLIVKNKALLNPSLWG